MEDVTHKPFKNSQCAVIVAHPDDETLWAGGTILLNPDNEWTIITICRKYDPERSANFSAVLKILNANGAMGDLDDGPEQTPLNPEHVDKMILSLLPEKKYNLILTHSPQGEYTRHRRHEEVAESVLRLFDTEKLQTDKLWMFAYEDGNKQYLPKAIQWADRTRHLPQDIWNQKYHIMTDIYGFDANSWEAKTTPQKEAFWTFLSACGVKEWINERSLKK